ncbi:MAG TPA: D-hexose-6-phosphate mutarotase [Polyangia bacterium]
MAATGWKQDVRNGLEVVELTTPTSTCMLALHGGQVLGFVPHGAGERLWVSEKARFQVGKALRGGIPICFPWFGPHPDLGDLPAHGFARTRLWRMVGVAAINERQIRAELELAPDADTLRLFPHRFVARLAVTAGETLELAFEVTNTDEAPFTFEIALHTYLAVSDAAAVALVGLGGRAYLDKVAGGIVRRQADEPVRFAGEVDRVYDNDRPLTLVDRGAGRIQIESRGAGSTVVWNPGPEKTRALGDMSPDGFRGFVCVETGSVGDRRVTLAPGGRHETAVSYAWHVTR